MELRSLRTRKVPRTVFTLIYSAVLVVLAALPYTKFRESLPDKLRNLVNFYWVEAWNLQGVLALSAMAITFYVMLSRRARSVGGSSFARKVAIPLPLACTALLILASWAGSTPRSAVSIWLSGFLFGQSVFLTNFLSAGLFSAFGVLGFGPWNSVWEERMGFSLLVIYIVVSSVAVYEFLRVYFRRWASKPSRIDTLLEDSFKFGALSAASLLLTCVVNGIYEVPSSAGHYWHWYSFLLLAAIPGPEGEAPILLYLGSGNVKTPRKYWILPFITAAGALAVSNALPVLVPLAGMVCLLVAFLYPKRFYWAVERKKVVVEEVYVPEPIPLGGEGVKEASGSEERTLEDLKRLDRFAEEILEEK